MPRFTILLMPFVLVGILETYAATKTFSILAHLR
jgi:hypothetical protein